MPSSSPSTSRHSALFIACILIFITSFCISPPLLNTFVNYTLPGGGILQKIHPATYLVAGVFIFMSSHKFPIYRENERNYNFIFIIISLIFYAITIGNFGYTSITIDIFLAPAVFSIIYQRLNQQNQIYLLKLFIFISCINTIIVAVELAGQRSFLNYEQEFSYFRPAGIFGHPIATGAICCIAMLSCRYVVVNTFTRRTILTILLCQVSMCGVRAALAVAAIVFFSDIVAEQKRTMRVVVYDMLILSAVVFTILIFASIGVFDRILARGVWDDSAASRFDIFNIFSVMSDDEFWLGTSPERILMYAQSLNQSRIENSFVVSVYQCGFISSIVLFAAIFIYFLRSVLKSLNFLILLVFIVFGTLYFGVKSPVNYPLLLLGQVISTTRNHRLSKHVASDHQFSYGQGRLIQNGDH